MGSDRPMVSSRTRRGIQYVAHNRTAIFVDAVVIIAWVVGVWTIMGMLILPRWFIYLVLFGGVLVYTRITRPWERPYLSPDLADED